MLNPFFGMCVLKALGEVEYPAPLGPNGEEDGDLLVRYPFTFRAE